MSIKHVYFFILSILIFTFHNVVAESYKNDFIEISSPKKGAVYNTPTVNITGEFQIP